MEVKVDDFQKFAKVWSYVSPPEFVVEHSEAKHDDSRRSFLARTAKSTHWRGCCFRTRQDKHAMAGDHFGQKTSQIF
jgi:hypothetical protein